jgi:hypothetical protein
MFRPRFEPNTSRIRIWSVIATPARSDDDDNNSVLYFVQFFIYLRAELNSQWPITESAQIQTTGLSIGQNKQKTAKQRKTN